MPDEAAREHADGRHDRVGRGVQDFPSDSVLTAVRKSFDLLPPRQRKILALAAIAQTSLGLLDLVGVILIGLLAAVAVSGIGATGMPPIVTNALETLGLTDYTVSQLTVMFAVAAVSILVSKTILSAILTRLIYRFLARQQAEISARLARKFLSRPLLEVQKWTESEAVYALNTGVSAATVAILSSAITIIAEVFLFAVMGISLAIVDFWLTVACIALFAGIIALLHRTLTHWTTRNSGILTGTAIDTFTSVSEALQTYRETIVLNRRQLYIGRFQRLIGRAAQANASNAFIVEIPKFVLESALYLGILLLAVVQFLTKDLAAAASTVALFMSAGSRIVPALLRLQGASITIRNASVQAQPTLFLVQELQDAHHDPAVIEAAMNPMAALVLKESIATGHPNFDASLRVRDVSVTYPGADAPALANASLDAAAGTSVALVGSTGAGKSTLADVLLGVIEPDQGFVEISGFAPQVSIARWPGAISYVPQAVALVAGSVRANVALGLPREAVDDELVWEALRRAHLDDYLREYRNGIDTSVGERGVRLSGGQRQRLGIARALYTRPGFLVLDEATSALDADTEQAIIATLDELEGEVTTVMVAHRLATVRRADQVLYLEKGSIVCRGTFEEVRAQVPDFDRQASLLGL